jgi:hypothetical protein
MTHDSPLRLPWLVWLLPVALAGCASGQPEAAEPRNPRYTAETSDSAWPAADTVDPADAARPSDDRGTEIDAAVPAGDTRAEVEVATAPEPDVVESGWECFGGTICDKGTVTRMGTGEQPPGHYGCDVVGAYMCEQGCAPDLHRHLDEFDLASYCRESLHLPAVGDACATSADCVWPHAPYFWNGVLQNIYLDCVDAACAEVPPVTIADFGHDCTLPPGGIVEPSTECVAGLCARPAYGWVDQKGTCTGPCTGDHECPPGHGCETSVVSYCQ